MEKILHPSLYQINTRVWLRRFDRDKHKARLIDVPNEFWSYLAKKGIDFIWFMGIWPTSEPGFDKNIFSENDVLHYKQILPDITEDDMIGSPYAIDQYKLNPDIATEKEFLQIKAVLNQKGIGIILDFVPNHFGAHSQLIDTRPDLFLHKPKQWKSKLPKLFFSHKSYPNKVFAHGKDPYFGAWRDTVQLNYCNELTRQFMSEQLEYIASLSDGVRCDMTMIVLNRVFKESWSHSLSEQEKLAWQGEFWSETISSLKEKYPSFLMMAECYWNLEGEMLQLGFDYSYDKSWTDHIKEKNETVLSSYLSSSPEYMKRMVHFLENHDEERIAKVLPEYQSTAASIILASMPGMRFYYQGQWEGRQTKLPVQLGREPKETKCDCILKYQLKIKNPETEEFIEKGIIDPVCLCTFCKYEQLLKIFNDPIFRRGHWKSLTLLSETKTKISPQPHMIWWEFENQHRLVVVNYSETKIAGRIYLNKLILRSNQKIYSILDDQKTSILTKSKEYINIELHAFAYKILVIE